MYRAVLSCTLPDGAMYGVLRIMFIETLCTPFALMAIFLYIICKLHTTSIVSCRTFNSVCHMISRHCRLPLIWYSVLTNDGDRGVNNSIGVRSWPGANFKDISSCFMC